TALRRGGYCRVATAGSADRGGDPDDVWLPEDRTAAGGGGPGPAGPVAGRWRLPGGGLGPGAGGRGPAARGGWGGVGARGGGRRTERLAAEAVRARLDCKYLLGLPVEHRGSPQTVETPGFDHMVLAEFWGNVAGAASRGGARCALAKPAANGPRRASL